MDPQRRYQLLQHTVSLKSEGSLYSTLISSLEPRLCMLFLLRSPAILVRLKLPANVFVSAEASVLAFHTTSTIGLAAVTGCCCMRRLLLSPASSTTSLRSLLIQRKIYISSKILSVRLSLQGDSLVPLRSSTNYVWRLSWSLEHMCKSKHSSSSPQEPKLFIEPLRRLWIIPLNHITTRLQRLASRHLLTSDNNKQSSSWICPRASRIGTLGTHRCMACLSRTLMILTLGLIGSKRRGQTRRLKHRTIC